MCVCVCVCVQERERERERDVNNKISLFVSKVSKKDSMPNYWPNNLSVLIARRWIAFRIHWWSRPESYRGRSVPDTKNIKLPNYIGLSVKTCVTEYLKIKAFQALNKLSGFLVVKLSIYLNRHVFIMGLRYPHACNGKTKQNACMHVINM